MVSLVTRLWHKPTAPAAAKELTMVVSVLALPVLALTVVAAILGLAAAWPRPATQRLRAVQTTTRAWRAAGSVAGVAAAVMLAAVGPDDGRALAVAPSVVGLGALLGVVVGEMRTTAPGGTVRHAPLEVRRARDYLPSTLGRVVAGLTVTLVVALVVGAALGTTSDLGRAGAVLLRRCSDVASVTRGPWPGAFYGVPVAGVVAVGLATAAAALVLIARRPRQGEDPVVDDALRRRAAAAVTAASGLLVALPLAGVAATAGLALARIECAPSWWTPLGVAWGLVAVAACAVAVWCASIITSDAASPTRRSVVEADRR